MTVGRENYTLYYYLWHLIAVGVLKAGPTACDQQCPEIKETVWEKAFARDCAKIALIDMGVATHHPNLEPRPGGSDPQDKRIVTNEALDLASHRYGVKYRPMNQRHLEDRNQHLKCIDPQIIGDVSNNERQILERIKDGRGVVRYVNKYNQAYSTHGTACAGLVCATSYSDDQFGNQGNIITYYGVDPNSRIVPITTSISPDPEQLIAAFLYAYSLNVDVILFPRDVADPLHMPYSCKVDKNEKTRIHTPGQDDVAWCLLKKVIIAVSKDIPIVCAAGNDGRSELIYPASLAKEDGNGIIAVGAVSFRGYRSGYSNYGDGLTVVAPSDDGEIYNRHQLRLDREAANAADFWIDDVHKQPCDIPEIEFSAERLITLDVPGPRGYSMGSRRGLPANRSEALDDSTSLYTELGGTSGAAAIVAGVVALMQRRSQTRIDGIEIKRRLRSDGTNLDIRHWYWLGNATGELRRDAVNGSLIPEYDKLFGEGGLIDIQKLLI